MMHQRPKAKRPSWQEPVQASAGQDWFLATFLADCSLAEVLSSIVSTLGSRLEFTRCLQEVLYGPLAARRPVDILTRLAHRMHMLEQTLKVRLPLLKAEQTPAWFQASAQSHAGPFAANLLQEPVFAPFRGPGLNSQAIAAALAKAWASKQAAPLPFLDGSPCLWRSLLQLQHDLAQVGPLPEPFAALNLMHKDLVLPASITSPALHQFLKGVRGELLRLHAQMGSCYQALTAASTEFWQAYDAGLNRQKTSRRFEGRHAEERRERATRRNTTTGGQSGATGPSSGGRQPYKSPKDLQALRTFGLAEFPAPADLKSHYRRLAKQLHPDLAGGDDHGFKLLVEAYCHLQERLS